MNRPANAERQTFGTILLQRNNSPYSHKRENHYHRAPAHAKSRDGQRMRVWDMETVIEEGDMDNAKSCTISDVRI